jgi:DNA-binding NarL/FixJ family response regulator
MTITTESNTTTSASTETKRSQSFLIVDDHPIVRDSLHLLLQELEPGCNTSLATSLAQMRESLQSNTVFDYAIVDLNLPDSHGLDTLKAVRELRPELPIIVYSGRAEQDTILRCLNFGVVGYIPKTQYGDLITQALRMVFSGQTYVPRQAVSEANRRLYNLNTPMTTSSATDPRELGMTERQIEVLTLMLRGLPNKLICRKLNLAEGTVKVHVSNVLRALGVRNRTQAVIAAGELGLNVD